MISIRLEGSITVQSKSKSLLLFYHVTTLHTHKEQMVKHDIYIYIYIYKGNFVILTRCLTEITSYIVYLKLKIKKKIYIVIYNYGFQLVQLIKFFMVV